MQQAEEMVELAYADCNRRLTKDQLQLIAIANLQGAMFCKLNLAEDIIRVSYYFRGDFTHVVLNVHHDGFRKEFSLVGVAKRNRQDTYDPNYGAALAFARAITGLPIGEKTLTYDAANATLAEPSFFGKIANAFRDLFSPNRVGETATA